MNTMEFPSRHSTSISPPLPRWLECVSQLDPKHGGMSAVVPQLSSRLAQQNNLRIDIAAFAAEDETGLLDGHPEVASHHWTASRKEWLLNRSLRTELDSLVKQTDGLHIHGLWETHGAVCAAAARRCGKPYIVSAHGMLEPWALAQKSMKKRIYAALVERGNLHHAACVHALTDDELNDYRRFGYRGPVAVIPNAIELPDSVDASLLSKAFPQVSCRRVVLFLGRLHPKKGVEVLLRAWADLALAHPDALLMLAGPVAEDYGAQLQKITAESGMTDRVVFTGMMGSDLKWSALASAKCFVLPSFSEGLSMAVLEALGMSLPVILTRQCHMPEVAASGAGWEIAPNREELVTALATVLNNSDAANARIGAQGRRLVEHHFTWPIVARQMASLYRWVTSGMPPQDRPTEVCV